MKITFEKTSGTAPRAQPRSRSLSGKLYAPANSLLLSSRTPLELRKIGNPALDKASMIFVTTCLVAIGVLLGAAVSIGLLFFA